MQHVDDRYLARPAAGYGEAAAGDHLRLGRAFWLPGHQLENGVRFVAVHRGLCRQSGWFAADCADRAGAAVRRKGSVLLGRDGAISTWQAPS